MKRIWKQNQIILLSVLISAARVILKSHLLKKKISDFANTMPHPHISRLIFGLEP